MGYAECSNIDDGATVSIYNGSATLIDRQYIPQGKLNTNQWKLRDLRYNALSGNLYLLQDMNKPVSLSAIISVICEFRISSLGAISGATAYEQNGITYFSLDQFVNNWETVAVGIKTTDLRLWRHNGLNTCIQNYSLSTVVNALPDNSSVYRIYPARTVTVAPASYSISFIKIPLTNYCR